MRKGRRHPGQWTWPGCLLLCVAVFAPRGESCSGIGFEARFHPSFINKYVTVLQSDSLTKEQRDSILERLRLSSEQLSQIVGNVLQISRLESNKILPLESDFDLSEQLVQTFLGFEQALEEKNIEMEADFDDGVMVRSDEGLLRMVWNNLLSKAVKFTPEGGMISIHAERQPGVTCVTVQDSGVGIAEEDQSRIFEKFYQADRSHSTKGNGLGLALVKNICTLLGCEITLKSSLGEGAAFTVCIPDVGDRKEE